MAALQDEIGGLNLPLEMTLHLLGLRGVADTIVGNAAVRGVSGGERHRVTTAEMASGKSNIIVLEISINFKWESIRSNYKYMNGVKYSKQRRGTNLSCD